MSVTNAYQGKRKKTGINHFALLLTFVSAVPSVFELSREASAIGIAALTLLPLLLIWVKRKRFLVSDPIIVLGLIWMLAVTLPVLFPDLYRSRFWYELPSWSLDEAARWMYRSWAAACLAYWLGRIWFKPRRTRVPNHFDGNIQILMRRWVGIVGFSGTVMFVIITGGQTSQLLKQTATADSTTIQIIRLLMDMSYAYVFLHVFEQGRGARLFKIDKYLLYAVLGAQIIVFIGSGSKYSMMVLAACWMLGKASSLSRKGFFKELMIGLAGIVAIVSISYFVAAYRGELVSRSMPPSEASITQVVGFQFDVMTTAVGTIIEGGDISKGYYQNYDSSFILDRFAHLFRLAVFMNFIGWESPYEHAFLALATPVFAIVPRALLPDKVHFLDSGDFARMIGWEHGGVSITTPGSLFWAWGYAGIILGMAAMGILIAWLWVRASGLDSTAFIWRTVMIMVVVKLLDLGVTFQSIVIPATRVLLLMLLIRWALQILSSPSIRKGVVR